MFPLFWFQARSANTGVRSVHRVDEERERRRSDMNTSRSSCVRCFFPRSKSSDNNAEVNPPVRAVVRLRSTGRLSLFLKAVKTLLAAADNYDTRFFPTQFPSKFD